MYFIRRIEIFTKKSSSISADFTVDPANCTVAVCSVCDIKLSHIYYPVLAGY